jgi:hypothetical protein
MMIKALIPRQTERVKMIGTTDDGQRVYVEDPEDRLVGLPLFSRQRPRRQSPLPKRKLF